MEMSSAWQRGALAWENVRLKIIAGYVVLTALPVHIWTIGEEL